jgi:hypothetical protein
VRVIKTYYYINYNKWAMIVIANADTTRWCTHMVGGGWIRYIHMYVDKLVISQMRSMRLAHNLSWVRPTPLHRCWRIPRLSIIHPPYKSLQTTVHAYQMVCCNALSWNLQTAIAMVHCVSLFIIYISNAIR